MRSHAASGPHGGAESRRPSRPRRRSQIVIEKQTVDAFQTHTFERAIRQLNPARVVVYGVVTEICVLHAVRGLRRLGIPVAVAADAIQALSPEASAAALEEMRAAGSTLTTAAEETS